MWKYTILFYFSVIAIWLLIENVINNRFSQLEQIEISYFTETDPIDFTVYYSSSEFFRREAFFKGRYEKVHNNKYRVVFHLKDSKINNIRFDPEFKKIEDDVLITEIKLISKKSIILIQGKDINRQIKSINKLMCTSSYSGLKISPSSPVDRSDYSIILFPLKNVAQFYLGGISKKVFLNLILVTLLIVAFFKSVSYSDSFQWVLIVSFFVAAIFFNKVTLIIGIILFVISSITYSSQKQSKLARKQRFFYNLNCILSLSHIPNFLR